MKLLNITISFSTVTIFALVFFLHGYPVEAQDAKTSNDSIKLVGSDLKLEKAVTSSDLIFIGAITDMGIQDQITKRPLAGPLYHGASIQIIRALKGSKKSPIYASLLVSGIAHESFPALGKEYIFLVSKNADKDIDPYTIIKMLPTADVNIAKIKALIAAAPPSK